MWPFMILFSGQCLGMVVEGGYMFMMDPDMSSFPRITWHCPKYKTDGCPASFVTRITNVEKVGATELIHKPNLNHFFVFKKLLV